MCPLCVGHLAKTGKGSVPRTLKLLVWEAFAEDEAVAGVEVVAEVGVAITNTALQLRTPKPLAAKFHSVGVSLAWST